MEPRRLKVESESATKNESGFKYCFMQMAPVKMAKSGILIWLHDQIDKTSSFEGLVNKFEKND